MTGPAAHRWRRELAEQLHREAVQELVVVELCLQRLAGRAADPAQAAIVQEARNAAGRAVADLRRLMSRLDPAAGLYPVDAAGLLRRLATAASSESRASACEVVGDAGPVLEGPVVDLVVPVLAEVVAACGRQGRGAVSSVTVRHDPGRLHLTIVAASSPGSAPVDADASVWSEVAALVQAVHGTFSATGGNPSAPARVELVLPLPD